MRRNQHYTIVFFILLETLFFNAKTFAQDLVLTDQRLQYLHQVYQNDPILKQYVDNSINYANTLLSADLPNEGGDMLTSAFNSLQLLTNLGFAYRWTSNTAYAIKAEQVLLAVCAFSDWNPPHFIDAAIMGIAVSFGVDWIEDYLSDDNQTIIVQAIINKTLNPGIEQMNNNAYWTWIDNNWNIICNSGMIISSLTVESYDNSYSDIVLPRAINSLHYPLEQFNPDGTWFEGMAYMEMSMDLYSYCVASLISYRGDDLGLLDYPGLGYAGEFLISSEGKNIKWLCFSDIYNKYPRVLAPSLFYLGKMYNNPQIIANERDFIARKNNNEVFHVIWYETSEAEILSNGNKYYGGDHAFVFLNEDVTNNNAIYVGVKAGKNGTSHGHLDIGNFEFDAIGIRWARDLGSDNYGLPGYFDFESDGDQRWTYYRTGSLSHNVPIINGNNQLVSSQGHFTEYSLSADEPYCIMDLHDPYRNYASTLNRGIKLVDEKRSMIVQDEYSLLSSQDCYWGLTTDAQIQIIDNKSAILTQDGKQLYATILSPANGSFEIQSARQDPGGYPVTGVSRLIARKPSDGVLDFTLCVQLSPNWNGYHTPLLDLIPLDQWGNDLPYPPSNLQASVISSSQINLSWDESISGENIEGYNVYRDHTFIDNINELTYSDVELNPGTQYIYEISAVDISGNESNPTDEVRVTTLVIPDNEPPSPPINLMGSAVSSSQVNLIWIASTDNFSVGGYIIYRDDVEINRTPNLEYSDYDLNAGTSYEYSVSAYDEAGNEGSQSNHVIATTLLLEKIVYIDPESSNPDTLTGSLDAPLKSWSQVEWKDGFAYLQKRNTSSNEQKMLITADNVFIGAYGIGERPRINSTSSDYAISLFDKKNISITDLEIVSSDAIATIYFFGDNCDSNLIEKCRIIGNEYCLRIVGGDNYIIRYNEFEANLNALYTMASNTNIYYNEFTKTETAIHINDYSSEVEVCNNVFFDNMKAVSSSYGGLTLYNNIFSLERPGSIAITQELDLIISDYNIFYPIHTGFIRIADRSYNDLYAYQTECFMDINSKDTDPLFVDILCGNFKLQDGSPGIESGIDIGLKVDKFGSAVPYGNYPDIGIQETDRIISTAYNALFERENSVTVFPNPNNGVFSVQLIGSASSKFNIQVINENGDQVYSQRVSHQPELGFNLGFLENGVYLLLIKGDKHQYIEKLFITN